jgi:HK97 family phage portal protein
MSGARFQNWFTRNIWDARAGNISFENPQYPLNGWTVEQVLGGGLTSTGQSINYDSTLTLSAVYRAASILEGIISSFPLGVYNKTESGRVQLKPSEHNLAGMWARKVNPNTTKVHFISRAVDHWLFWGNHYAGIRENGIGRPYRLDLWHPRDVQVYEGEDGEIAYKYKNKPYPASKVLHVKNIGDDIIGKGIITKAREDFAMQMNARQFGSNFYAKGGRPSGILSPKNPLPDTKRAEAEKVWTAAKQRGTDILMPFGIDYTAISMPPEDAFWLASNQISVSDISRWTGVPPHKLAELGRATFNNAETMGIEFLQDTIWPICEKFEAEYDSKLLTLPSESDMYNEFNIDAYLRADSLTKAEVQSTLINNGIKTPNEVRRMNNDQADPNGDELMVQGAMIPLKMAGQIQMQAKAAPAKRRQRRYSLPEIQSILQERYGMTNEQLDMFAKEKTNGHQH